MFVYLYDYALFLPVKYGGANAPLLESSAQTHLLPRPLSVGFVAEITTEAGRFFVQNTPPARPDNLKRALQSLCKRHPHPRCIPRWQETHIAQRVNRRRLPTV